MQDVANDLNMAVGTLGKWISKSNRKNGVSKPGTQLPDDLPAQSRGPAQRLLALNQTARDVADTAACMVSGKRIVWSMSSIGSNPPRHRIARRAEPLPGCINGRLRNIKHADVKVARTAKIINQGRLAATDVNDGHCTVWRGFFYPRK